MYQRYHIVDKIVQFALTRFPIFSYICNSQRIGIPILNEWTDAAVLCCHGKSRSYIPKSKVIGSYIKKRLMLFNLAFEIKCK